MLFEDYSRIISHAIESICFTQKDKILQAAELAAGTIEADGLIYVFGCGHSGILSCEAFFRSGGLACAAPIFCEPLMLHKSAVESSRLEKLSGYAQQLQTMYPLEPRDMLICISTSDKNAVPVEYAVYAASLGVPTVAVCSAAYFTQEAHNAYHKHLHEVCTLYIDNSVPYGDACLQLTGDCPRMAPLSTITGTYILNSVLAEAAQLALSRGVDVPIYLSGNIPGGADRNQVLIKRYSSRIPHL